ncbi:hypothetical protein K488DRAFT_88084 [Vararia minispora EC-137]|uniref:Uncharacterized protein n=1 Tax=Vararia minispora EC-137 TaxID=1314806 RepID=A0ACB8QEI6_9AGAM|nr:hypothetical protein K488DRAFT_88084 [Vararia minispora EC-137]
MSSPRPSPCAVPPPSSPSATSMPELSPPTHTLSSPPSPSPPFSAPPSPLLSFPSASPSPLLPQTSTHPAAAMNSGIPDYFNVRLVTEHHESIDVPHYQQRKLRQPAFCRYREQDFDVSHRHFIADSQASAPAQLTAPATFSSASLFSVHTFQHSSSSVSLSLVLLSSASQTILSPPLGQVASPAPGLLGAYQTLQASYVSTSIEPAADQAADVVHH